MMLTGPGKWTLIPEPRPAATIRLVCFHHLGGGAYGFRPWAKKLAPHIELVAVQLPGRENRHAEPPLDTVGAIFNGLIPALRGQAVMRYALFGHSLGATLAYLLACRARRDGELPAPERLFLSAATAPVVDPEDAPVDLAPPEISDSALFAVLRRAGGQSPEALRDPTLLRAILPTLRADAKVMLRHRFTPEAPLNAPFTLLRGEGDRFVTRLGLATWRPLTSAGSRMHSLPGGHFYSPEGQVALIGRINAALRAHP